MNAESVALILAVVSLVILVVRRPPSGAPSRPPIWLVPVAGIVGLLPRILQLSDAMKRAGSVTSIVLSLTAIGLFLMHTLWARKS
jgi:hypothetical protein